MPFIFTSTKMQKNAGHDQINKGIITQFKEIYTKMKSIFVLPLSVVDAVIKYAGNVYTEYHSVLGARCIIEKTE